MHLVINFSGGKDSTAMLALLTAKYPDVPKTVIMADTGWEHPGAVEWSTKVCKLLGHDLVVVQATDKDGNPKTFHSLVRKRRMFPDSRSRFCTSDLKRNPIQKWIRHNIEDPVIVNCLGIRAEESKARAKKPRMSRDKSMTNSKRTVWTWHPILEWPVTQVFEFLRLARLPLHPVYKYLSRFSCRVCIFQPKSELKATLCHDREAFDNIARLEREIGFSMRSNGYLDELFTLQTELELAYG